MAIAWLNIASPPGTQLKTEVIPAKYSLAELQPKPSFSDNDVVVGLPAGNAVLIPGGSYNNGNMLGGPLKSQVKGWLVPPETGEYVFWIHSNNKGEFWLSTDSHAANKVLLSCKQKSIETRYWTMCTGPLISLVAGHKYYYEVRKLVIFTMF